MEEEKSLNCCLEIHKNISEEGPVDKCVQWLDKCTMSDCASSTCDGSSICSEFTENSAMDSGYVFSHNSIAMGNEIIASPQAEALALEGLLNKKNNFGDIHIRNSRKVHIGDVNYIYISQTAINNQEITINNNNTTTSVPIITRPNWLAQPPLKPPSRLKEPAKYVVIVHSATEEGFTQAQNTLHVRLIQTFHIESRNFDDISYNFLIGADGCVFEGRGWGVIGAYAHNYNKLSIGICFIGCYVQHKPPEIALRRAKALIKLGVEIGAIDPDYKILGHCQCSSTESPGRILYEEIQTWDRWDGSVTVDKPSPLVDI